MLVRIARSKKAILLVNEMILVNVFVNFALAAATWLESMPFAVILLLCNLYGKNAPGPCRNSGFIPLFLRLPATK